ncbi:MAG: hypothetical protein Q7S27_01790 [Nanoarchaeota archaeon]|nr:hypothetical protein [Nanoarchaeota archaeon]
MQIKELSARKILDSRNEPTIEVSANNQKASSPSGKSTGKYETPCYHKSLEWNIKAINNLIIPFEINSFNDLKKIEALIKNKFKFKDAKQFGANALFALESAILKALAKSQGKQLWQIINPSAKKMPIPVGNAIGGGLHSHNKNHPDFQEFLLIPKGKSMKENVKIMQKVYKNLKKIIKTNSKNDEGAWQTSLSNEDVLAVISKITEVRIGLDIASSSFYKNSEYHYQNKSLSTEAQIHYINSLTKKYDIFYLEDPIQEEDFKSFSKISRTASNLIVGDDLTATHISRLNKAIKSKSISAMIIKPNQNGSLIELQEIFNICRKNDIKTVLSHRSGETLDNSLADYAFGFQANYIKCGISTKWREVKLKRLVEIEKTN